MPSSQRETVTTLYVCNNRAGGHRELAALKPLNCWRGGEEASGGVLDVPSRLEDRRCRLGEGEPRRLNQGGTYPPTPSCLHCSLHPRFPFRTSYNCSSDEDVKDDSGRRCCTPIPSLRGTGVFVLVVVSVFGGYALFSASLGGDETSLLALCGSGDPACCALPWGLYPVDCG